MLILEIKLYEFDQVFIFTFCLIIAGYNYKDNNHNFNSLIHFSFLRHL
jgi:hypothetical protein